MQQEGLKDIMAVKSNVMYFAGIAQYGRATDS